MRGTAALALALAACGRGDPPPSVVLVTLDTTNREALGCYGQPLALTPNLDRVAGEGIVFDQARTVAPLTLPAHAAMQTGLVPLRTGLRDNGLCPLPAEAVTLAERLKAAGYQTAAFVSAVVLAAPYGLDQGFETYDAPRTTEGAGTGHVPERPTAETVSAALDWLRAREPERPFFLWVHGFEPHEPHAPPAEFLRRAGGDPYLGEVAALDSALGVLLAELDARVGPERLVLVISGDHGESLGDHGERTHSVLCYERVLRVPLFLRLPRGARAGTRVDSAVSVADVMPTVLDLLGLVPERDIDGVSLLTPEAQRGLFFESATGFLNYGWSPLYGWTDGATKYLHGTSPELYDLRADPGELTNLVEVRPEAVARARAALERLGARPRLERSSARLDERLAAEVQALGYAGSAGGASEVPGPLEDTGLPAPRTRMQELERFYRALLRHENGKPDLAIAELEALVAENPRNTTALNVLATYLFARRDLRRALDVLERIPEAARERVTVQDLFGHCLEGLGQTPEALRHFETALELKPGDEHQERDVERVRARVEEGGTRSGAPR